MTPAERLEELQYHLRELRADLACVQSDLQTAATTELSRSVVSAWGGAVAQLEHDFEVHFPRAFALLEAELTQGIEPGASELLSELRSPGSEVLAAVAREAGAMIAKAIVLLPSDSEPPQSASALLEVVRISAAVYRLIVVRSEQALAEELIQERHRLNTPLLSAQAHLETIIHINPQSTPAWASVRALLDRALDTHFLRAFQILHADPPEWSPPAAMPPLEVSADALESAAREASRLVATALANLPSVMEPSTCEAELREASQATSAAQYIVAAAHDLLIRSEH